MQNCRLIFSIPKNYQNFVSLYNSPLKQSSALIFVQGTNLSEYFFRCKYGCNRSLYFGVVGVQRNFTDGRMRKCCLIFSIPNSFESLQNINMYIHSQVKYNKAISILAFIPFWSYSRTNLYLQNCRRTTVRKVCN